jgi:hypothetical protein
MDGPGHQTGYRNIARHEETFNEALYGHIKRTPWWLISIGFHGVLVLALFSAAIGPEYSDAIAAVNSTVEENLLDPLLEPIKPEIQDKLPEEEIERPIDHISEVDAPDADHDETDNDQMYDESLGDVGMDDSPFQGPSTNAAIGIGPGAGGAYPGRGGNERLRASGSTTSNRRAVMGGLEWLKNHQDKDGYWDCDGFMEQCKVNQCGGPGDAMYDPGVSGLALLAFLGAGETHKFGNYKKTVRNGLKYLKQIQDPEGCIGPRTTNHFTYNHSIATLALVEAYGLTASPLFKQSAQSAIDFIHKAQNPYLAWRYGVRPQDNDTSVTGWMVMALKSAKICGLRVDQAAFDGAGAWINKATEPEYGRVGYTSRGTGPARPQNLMDKFPADKSESLTAVGMLTRIFIGEDPRKSEMIQKGKDLCLKNLPVWDEQSGSIDMYYWYYGTLAMFQVGGKEVWKPWMDAMEEAIIKNQRQEGDEKGSWDPVGPWGNEGGRVYSTALMTMCMEVYYRYPRVFGAGSKR